MDCFAAMRAPAATGGQIFIRFLEAVMVVTRCG